MDSWNVYSQNAPGTPNSTWLCPQNNAQSSEWLHPQNNSIERERNGNTTAPLATPTRYIMEYNDVNQNSSSGSYYSQEMERLFESNFLKLDNPEDLLKYDIYNNENLSWLNTSEATVPATTTSSSNNIVTDPISTTSVTTSPTTSLTRGNDKDQAYNNQQREQCPVTTSASFIQYPMVNENQQIVSNTSSSTKTTTSPITSRECQYPMTTTTSSTFYQSALSSHHQQSLLHSTSTNNQDHYLQTKKHGPKQLLLPLPLPLTTNSALMDGTMAVAITSPTSSIDTDDDDEEEVDDDQFKTKCRRQNYYQLNNSSNELPMQQPSPASSNSAKSPSLSSNDDVTPKQKKRKVSQRKLGNRKSSRVNEGSLISPTDELYSGRNLMISTTASNIAVSESDEASPISSNFLTKSVDSSPSELNIKRDIPDDGRDETPEEKRARLLERNRIAAAKCRQKKKQAQECLQQQASDLTQKNTSMHTLVNDLREEALKLKNQLLAHSTCNCNVIQEYVRTSGQFAFARPPYTK